MSSLKKSIAITAIAVVGGLSLSGCATTKYVDEQIAAVNAHINEVDARAQAAAQAANAAAQAAAAQAATANQRLDQLTPRVDALEARPMKAARH
jgi:murein lipoprotein